MKHKNELMNSDLATQDFSGKLFIQTKLYGREKELIYLNNLFNTVGQRQKNNLIVIRLFGQW